MNVLINNCVVKADQSTSAYEKIEAPWKKKASVEKQPIINSRPQEDVVLRIQIVGYSILFNQVKIDGVTGGKKSM